MKLLCRLLALAVLLAPAVAPAAPPKSGTWEMAYSGNATIEQVVCLFKIDVKDDGAISGSLVAASPSFRGLEITKVAIDGDVVRVTLKLPTSELTFEGVVAKPDGKVPGSFGDEKRINVARIAPSEKTELAQADILKRLTAPAPMAKAQQLISRPLLLRSQAARATDPDDKAKILKDAAEAADAAKIEVPKLYMEVIEKHSDSPAALDAAMNLINQAGKNDATVDQVAKWAELAGKVSKNYGPRYAAETTVKLAEALGTQKAFASLAEKLASAAEKALGKNDSTDRQVRVLETLVGALRNSGKTSDADLFDSRLNKLQLVLDAEYKAKMPFKPTAFEGRKEKSDRVVVMELFTGAQCPPCVAADMAFDGLEKTYKPTDVILLQNHMHIAGPDPMTNPVTEGRWAYYRKVHGDNALRGVPSSLFNGKPDAAGGGGSPQAESKYQKYREIIEKLLEEPAGASVSLTAKRDGNTIKINAEVSNLKEPGEDKRLRFVLAEEEIRFTGSNNIRFHHMVVRDQPGGADGFKLTEKTGKHSASVNLDTLKVDLVNYLDDFVEKRGPFPKPQRPLALTHLKVIALVQDDKTGEILQAAQVDLDGGERVAK